MVRILGLDPGLAIMDLGCWIVRWGRGDRPITSKCWILA